MPDPKQTKVLFRCLFAYSNGVPVAVFDMVENRLLGDRVLEATPNSGSKVEVAVVGDTSNLDCDATECPELLAAAYEMFVNDGEVSSDHVEWVGLETT